MQPLELEGLPVSGSGVSQLQGSTTMPTTPLLFLTLEFPKICSGPRSVEQGQRQLRPETLGSCTMEMKSTSHNHNKVTSTAH